jgi:predicted RecB family nuclease
VQHPSNGSTAGLPRAIQRSKQRILDYNEDDNRAARVLLDGIRRLSER